MADREQGFVMRALTPEEAKHKDKLAASEAVLQYFKDAAKNSGQPLDLRSELLTVITCGLMAMEMEKRGWKYDPALAAAPAAEPKVEAPAHG